MKIEDIKKVNLKEDDILVVKFKGSPSMKCLSDLKATMHNVFGPEQKYISLADGIEIEVVSPEWRETDGVMIRR